MKTQIPENAAAPIGEGMQHGRLNTDPLSFETVIIDTGFSGLLAAIRLKQSRLDDFVLLERSAELGGTWRDNTYPGAEVDVPTGLYSISFVPCPFRKRYAPQSELLSYTQHIIKKFQLREHARTNQSVTRLAWDEKRCVWNIGVASGERYVARFVIDTSGVLANPRTPDIEGAETFQGASFHTAQWNHEVPYAGKRMGVIGSGCFAAQVFPAVAGQAFWLTRPGVPILKLQAGSVILLPTLAWEFSSQTPRVPGDGLLHGAVLEHGNGRVAVFGEAAMFSAQVSGADRRPWA